MSTAPCGCVYATALNTESVRQGFEVGGYLKAPCGRHGGRVTHSDLASIEVRALAHVKAHEAEKRLLKAVKDYLDQAPNPTARKDRKAALYRAIYSGVTPELSQNTGGTLLAAPLVSSRS